MMMFPVLVSRVLVTLFVIILFAQAEAWNKRTLYERGTAFRVRHRPSRYLHPWQSVPLVKPLRLEQARNRVLYSPLRVLGSDGLGHGMATKNAEITTALRLGIAYTHRAPKFGSLSEKNAKVMEDFFGWGAAEMSGKQFHEDNCVPTPAPVAPVQHEIGLRDCNICSAVKNTSPLKMKNIVPVPEDISFRASHAAKPQVDSLISMHNDSNTVFQMAADRCGKYPILVDFSTSRPWFYHKYWRMHAVPETDIKAQSLALYGKPNVDRVEEENPFSAALVDNPLQFNDHEISIAVHVRRGDFFEAKNRKMLADNVYTKIIRSAQDVIEEQGGPFSTMPVAVYIYSEGRPKNNGSFLTHIRSALTNEYLDSTGVVRDAKWWQGVLLSDTPQETGRPKERKGKVPRIPRVELRISQPTIETLHQMIHADVFIGSLSGLSTYTVRTLSRAVQIFPGLSDHHTRAFCCSVNAHEETGVFDRTAFWHQWNAYRLANERFVEAKPKPGLSKTTPSASKMEVKEDSVDAKPNPSSDSVTGSTNKTEVANQSVSKNDEKTATPNDVSTKENESLEPRASTESSSIRTAVAEEM